MIQDLRQEYPKDVYFGLFENRRVGEAYKTILNQLGAKEDGTLLEDNKRRARIVLFGHSWGASAVVALSRKLERAGVPVTLTIQIDSVAKPFQNDWLIPPNVFQAVNFYQTHGLIHGRRKIVPADPARTTILGNFLWEYKGEPAECHGFSWRGRLLSKGHTEIECDRKIWWQVETLLRRHLPNPSVPQTEHRRVTPSTVTAAWDPRGSIQSEVLEAVKVRKEPRYLRHSLGAISVGINPDLTAAREHGIWDKEKSAKSIHQMTTAWWGAGLVGSL